jgi:hypothetical protein
VPVGLTLLGANYTLVKYESAAGESLDLQKTVLQAGMRRRSDATVAAHVRGGALIGTAPSYGGGWHQPASIQMRCGGPGLRTCKAGAL